MPNCRLHAGGHIRAVADHAALLAAGEDASFQNKVHLAMAGRGWDEVKTLGAKN